ncbi:MAG: sulfotransferase [Gammaproteobacteria bacterium]|nr:sulfotransferase [Gammaproteobacteria bacterium]
MGDNCCVDFLIAGAQKSGTTALAAFLAEHPGLCIAEGKEAHVFDAPDFDDGWSHESVSERFRPYFRHAKPEQLLGDATPISMFLPEIPERVHHYNPAMKWIVVLRHPVKRAWSHYAMEAGRGEECLPAWLAFLAEPWRLWLAGSSRAPDSAWRRHSYLARGDYATQLDRIARWFPAGQLLVLKHEELLLQHEACLLRVYDFLGVCAPVVLPRARHIFAGDYKLGEGNGILARFLNWWLSPYLNRLAKRHGIWFE